MAAIVRAAMAVTVVVLLAAAPAVLAQTAVTAPAAAELSVTHPWVMWLGGVAFLLIQGLFVYVWNSQKKITEDRLEKLEQQLDSEIQELGETVEKGFRDMRDSSNRQDTHTSEQLASSLRTLYEEIRRDRTENKATFDELWRQIRNQKESMSGIQLDMASKYHTKAELSEVVNAAVAPLTLEVRHLREILTIKGGTQ